MTPKPQQAGLGKRKVRPLYALLLICLLLQGGKYDCGTNAPISSMGSITGTLTNASTEQRISDADILVEGTSQSGRSDSLGRFSIFEVPIGAHVVTVAAGFYRFERRTVVFEAGQISSMNISLTENVDSSLFDYLGHIDGYHQYYVSKNKVDAFTSREMARDQNGHQVTISGQRENNVVCRAAVLRSESVRIGFGDCFEYFWCWTGGEPVVYTNWRPGLIPYGDGDDVALVSLDCFWDMDSSFNERYFVLEIE